MSYCHVYWTSSIFSLASVCPIPYLHFVQVWDQYSFSTLIYIFLKPVFCFSSLDFVFSLGKHHITHYPLSGTVSVFVFYGLVAINFFVVVLSSTPDRTNLKRIVPRLL